MNVATGTYTSKILWLDYYYCQPCRGRRIGKSVTFLLTTSKFESACLFARMEQSENKRCGSPELIKVKKDGFTLENRDDAYWVMTILLNDNKTGL